MQAGAPRCSLPLPPLSACWLVDQGAVACAEPSAPLPLNPPYRSASAGGAGCVRQAGSVAVPQGAGRHAACVGDRARPLPRPVRLLRALYAVPLGWAAAGNVVLHPPHSVSAPAAVQLDGLQKPAERPGECVLQQALRTHGALGARPALPPPPPPPLQRLATWARPADSPAPCCTCPPAACPHPAHLAGQLVCVC